MATPREVSLQMTRNIGIMAHIDAGTPELDVISIVVRLFKIALMQGVPCTDAIVKTLFHCREKVFHPLCIPTDTPFTVNFHNPTQLSVGSSMEVVRRCRNRQVDSKILVSFRILAYPEFRFTQGSFQRREQMGQSLCIVPHMRTTSVTRAKRILTSFPSPKSSIPLT